jgi:hypothetical protein
MTHGIMLLNYIHILFKTIVHNIQSRIKQSTCFGLLSHYQARTKNTCGVKCLFDVHNKDPMMA